MGVGLLKPLEATLTGLVWGAVHLLLRFTPVAKLLPKV